MTAVSASMPVGAPASSTGSASPIKKNLDQRDFLQLLVAQLRNQDPMQPMEDKEFMSQMAQFDTLDQLTQLNKTMQAMVMASTLGQASSLLGKDVEAAGPDGLVHGVVSAVSVINGQAVAEIGKDVVPVASIVRMTMGASTNTKGSTGSGTAV
jgi:flagellar basal-body rod modification protein FlgD